MNDMQWPQQLHDTCILQRLDVLRPCGQLSDGLHKVDARLLVVLEDLQDRPHDASPCSHDAQEHTDSDGRSLLQRPEGVGPLRGADAGVFLVLIRF